MVDIKVVWEFVYEKESLVCFLIKIAGLQSYKRRRTNKANKPHHDCFLLERCLWKVHREVEALLARCLYSQRRYTFTFIFTGNLCFAYPLHTRLDSVVFSSFWKIWIYFSAGFVLKKMIYESTSIRKFFDGQYGVMENETTETSTLGCGKTMPTSSMQR